MRSALALICGRYRSRRVMTEYQEAGKFQRMDTSTWNERQPTVAGRYARTCSWCDEDERRRWQPGRSAKWINWCRYSRDRPFSVWYGHNHNFNRPVVVNTTSEGLHSLSNQYEDHKTASGAVKIWPQTTKFKATKKLQFKHRQVPHNSPLRRWRFLSHSFRTAQCPSGQQTV